MFRRLSGLRRWVVLASALVMSVGSIPLAHAKRNVGELTFNAAAVGHSLVLISSDGSGKEFAVLKWPKPRVVTITGSRNEAIIAIAAPVSSHRVQCRHLYSGAAPWIGTVPLRI